MEKAKPLKPLTEKQERKIERAWHKAAANVNSACVKRGQELVREAKEHQKKRIEEGKRSTEALAKDLSGYVVGAVQGRIMTCGTLPITCLMCENRIGHLDRCLPCFDFSNFKKRGE